MRKGLIYRSFVYFLCFSFVLLTTGLPKITAEAKETSLPMGEMISSGHVTFEAQENVWKQVDPAHFPIFQGVRIKTEKGVALAVLPNNNQIEVGHDSLFFFQSDEQFRLVHGGVSFRVPSGTEMSFKVDNLSIGKTPLLHAANDPLISPPGGEVVGSITRHANGAVTVKSIRGPLAIQDQDRVVLAALSSGESLTLPSAIVSGTQRQMVAQVGEYPTGKAALDGPFLGLSNWTWMVICIAAVAAGGGAIAYTALQSDDSDDFFFIPTSP